MKRMEEREEENAILRLKQMEDRGGGRCSKIETNGRERGGERYSKIETNGRQRRRTLF